MLKIKNNDIYFSRGESVCPEFQIFMNNGQPFVMPPLNNNSGILAFTVKSGISDDIVLSKYLDLTKAPVYDGYTDLAEGGYCKFTSQEPVKFETVIEMYAAFGYSPNLNGDNTIVEPTDDTKKMRNRIAYVSETDIYYCWVQDTETNGHVVVYTFIFDLPIFPNDTIMLDSKDYVYDLIAYIGKLNETLEFPLSRVDWKLQLLSGHKLILEDSNNV